jgi:hypothetical protein
MRLRRCGAFARGLKLRGATEGYPEHAGVLVWSWQSKPRRRRARVRRPKHGQRRQLVMARAHAKLKGEADAELTEGTQDGLAKA